MHLRPSPSRQSPALGPPQEAGSCAGGARGLPTLTMDCDPFLGVEKAFCGHSGSLAWRAQWGEAGGERGATGTERGGELQRKKSSEEKGKRGREKKGDVARAPA